MLFLDCDVFLMECRWKRECDGDTKTNIYVTVKTGKQFHGKKKCKICEWKLWMFVSHGYSKLFFHLWKIDTRENFPQNARGKRSNLSPLIELQHCQKKNSWAVVSGESRFSDGKWNFISLIENNSIFKSEGEAFHRMVVC